LNNNIQANELINTDISLLKNIKQDEISTIVVALINYLQLNDLLLDCASRIEIKRKIIGPNFKDNNKYIYTDIKECYFNNICIKIKGENLGSNKFNLSGYENFKFDESSNLFLYKVNRNEGSLIDEKYSVESSIDKILINFPILLKFIFEFYNISSIDIIKFSEELEIKTKLKKLYEYRDMLNKEILHLEQKLSSYNYIKNLE